VNQSARPAAPQLPTCLNVVSHIHPQYGGVATSIPPLCEALEAGRRYRASVAAFCSSGEDVGGVATGKFSFTRFPAGRLRWALAPKLRQDLGLLVKNASVVHIHGIWQEHCGLSAIQGLKHNKPVILSAHGMLEPWALGIKRWKKRLYLAAGHRGHLQSAACLRALTKSEADDYRRAGLRNPIAVIPNGVAIPPELNPAEFLQKYPELRGKRLLLFLGRLHYKKGIDLLAEAWGNLCGRFGDTQLVFAGPHSDESRKPLLETIDRLKIGSRITFTGILGGTLKWSALAAADVFILPSYSEGFSMAALEAMAAGCPVILSKACHFPEVEEVQCGWTIDPNLEALESAIRVCLTADRSLLRALGANGQHLARTRYDWAQVAGQIADVCDWLMGGAIPASTAIRTD
jgi:glycosyltransferase involved in cell wall biosynthesis